MVDCFQVTTTLPSGAAAEQIAARLVEERLAACAQVLGPVSSTYLWKGQIEQAAEWYCNLEDHGDAACRHCSERIRELHPYEVPEIVAIPILEGNADYLKWIEAVVRVVALRPRASLMGAASKDRAHRRPQRRGGRRGALPGQQLRKARSQQ